MPTTTPSSKGQLVLLREAPLFAPMTVDAAFGCLPRPARTVTLEEMDAAVMAETQRRFAKAAERLSDVPVPAP